MRFDPNSHHATGADHQVFALEIIDWHVNEGLGRTGIQHIAIPLLKAGQIGELDHLVVTAGKEKVYRVMVRLTGHGVWRLGGSQPQDMDGVGPSANLRQFR